VSDVAATPSGGAEVSARPDASATREPSITERIKASIFAEPEAEKPKPAASEMVSKPVKLETEKAEPAAKAAEEEVEAEAPTESEEAAPEEDALTAADLSTLDELSEATGLELDKLMDLSVKTKIDGKDGSVRLRDLLKSHQLEGHLNQKLMAHADEQKSFALKQQGWERERADKLIRMDAGYKTLERALAAEYADIDWQKLSAENPTEFNAKYVGYQQREAQLQDIGKLLGAEQQQHRQEMEARNAAYLKEQRSLLAAKVPEWSDQSRRAKDRLELGEYLKDKGMSLEDLDSVVDHRQILILKDAHAWHQLQKSKPSVLQKVRTAPKLLKPGTPQSRAAQEGFVAQKERDRLRSTGKVADARAPLKRLLFNG